MAEQKIVTLHLELNEYSLLFICYRFSLYSFSILWQRVPLLFTLSAAVHVECGVDCNEAGHLLASALFQSNSFKFRWAAGGAAPISGKMASKLTLLMIKNRSSIVTDCNKIRTWEIPLWWQILFVHMNWLLVQCRYFSMFWRIHVNAPTLTYHFVSFDHLPRCQLSVVCRVDQWHKTIWKNTDFVEPKI